MRESEFIRQNKKKWQEFESLFRGSRKSPRRLTELFVQITDDLSFARTFYPNRSVRVYLNTVSQRVFQRIYKPRKINLGSFSDFWTEELPQILYHSRKDLAVSFFVFLVALGIGVLSGVHDPTFANLILGGEYVEMTEGNIAKGDPMLVYKDSAPSEMFGRIFLNNLMVDLLAFVMGIFMAVGTLFVILYNGIMVGSFQYFFIERDLFQESFLTIWQHGTLEMSAMVVAGAAGITMGRGLAFPETYTRLQSFRLSAKRGFKIMLLVVPMTLVAAFLESWVTRHTGVPDMIRILAILAWLASVVMYVWWFPMLKARRGFKKPFGVERLPASREKPIVLDEIKSVGEMFTELFSHYTKIGQQLITIIGPAILILGVGLGIGQAYGYPQGLSFQVGATDKIFQTIKLVPEFVMLFMQFADYQYLPLFFPVNLILMAISCWIVVEGFNRYKGRSEIDFHRDKNWKDRITSLVPMALIHVIFFLPSGWAVFFALVTFPYLALWTVVILREKLSLLDALNRTADLIAAAHGTLISLYLAITLLSTIILVLVNSPLMGLYAQIIQVVIPLEGQSLDIFQAAYITVLYYAVVFILLPVQFAALTLYYYTAREIREANGLKARLGGFGVKSALARRFVMTGMLLISSLLNFENASALPQNAQAADVETTVPQEIRRFDKAQWEKEKKDLDYNQAPPTAQGSPQSSNFSLTGLDNIFKILGFSVVVLLVITLVYMLLKNFVKPSKSPEMITDEPEVIEDIADIDLAALLAKAESEGNWKEAIRVQFLLVIQALSNKDVIQWERDKTNREYLREMRPAENYGDFAELTLVFERIWYGDANVEVSDFRLLKPRFQKFLSEVNPR